MGVFSKALVALVMSVITIASVFGVNIGVDESTVIAVVGFITPVLIWLVPNLEK